MKTKPTIKPKRRAKALSDEALTVSADKLLNVLSKNTQEEKVFCSRCVYHVSMPYSDGWCEHESCFTKKTTPIRVEKVRVSDCNLKNKNNDCPNYLWSKPISHPDTIQVAPTPPKPKSLWQSIKDLFTWNK